MNQCKAQGCGKTADESGYCYFHRQTRNIKDSVREDMKKSIKDAEEILKELEKEGVFPEERFFAPEDVRAFAISLFIQRRRERI